MAYCGYAELLIVIIYIRVIYFVLLLIILFTIILVNNGSFLVSFKVFNLGIFRDIEIYINIWNLMFFFIVIFIRIRVIIFSFSYISSLSVTNFVFLYFRFVISIVWLILNNNFYWIIFGWDGLGVVSFLLIIFYINYERINNGLFTIFQNRVGDLFFVLFIIGIINIELHSNLVLKWGIIFLILGRCVKRAQFPFNAWLLSAISAPTPISSLVHSSTLVVAGVYILLQFSYCLNDILYLLKYISILTLFLRSFGLLNEVDIKKLIAYSTLNHVSLIIYFLSFQLFKIVYFHLNVHAMFKSLIFICFGFVILTSWHSQDKRLVLLLNLNPFIKIIYYFSCLCIAGLPFLRAFFSKDFIIEKIMESRLEFFFIIFLLFFLGIGVFYRIKLLNLIYPSYSYMIIEKRLMAIIRVLVIIFLMILIINVYISLVFSLSLEVFSNKIFIYIIILVFIILSIFTDFNYKIVRYEKIKNFKEIWLIDFYFLDKFMYSSIIIILLYINQLNKIKLFLIINWWIIILVIVLF